MPTNAIEPDRLEEIARLTREYSSFSRDAAGLGDVLGGSLFFLTAFLWNGHRGFLVRLLIAIAPFLWIATKEWLQRRVYQAEGRVEQLSTIPQRVALWVFTAFSIVLSGGIAYQVIDTAKGGGPGTYLRAGIALLILFSLPLLVGRYLRGGNEYFVGMWLMIHSAYAVYGKTPLVRYTTFIFLFAGLCALVLISEGLKQHRRLREIHGRLLSLRSVQ